VERNAHPLSQVNPLWQIKQMGDHPSINVKLAMPVSVGKELKFVMEEFNRVYDIPQVAALIALERVINFDL
jgi:hypothetical protein